MSRKTRQPILGMHRGRRSSRITRDAFTLLELLISMGIILILATLTMRLLNATLNSDRIRNGGREFQSFLAGARDRAVYAGQPRGVRLIQDAADQSCARSFVYIGAPANFTQGMIEVPGTPWAAGATVITGQLSQYVIPSGVAGNSPPFVYSAATPPAGAATVTEPTWPTTLGTSTPDPGNPAITWTCIGIANRFIDTTTAANNSWQQLAARGVLTNGCELDITGVGVFTVTQTSNGSWNLTKDLITPSTTPPLSTLQSYTLHLASSVLPGEEPRALPNNIVIDLDNSVLPSPWGTPGGYTGPLDLLFSPSGTVTGTSAGAGKIHFVLSEYVDASVPLPNTGTITGVPLMDTTNTYFLTSGTTYGPWVASTPYSLESWVVPNPQSDLAFRCVGAGTSGGGTQPGQFYTAAPGTQFSEGAGAPTWECYNPKTRIIVSVATETGRITTSPVNPQDRFRYAEAGEVTQ